MRDLNEGQVFVGIAMLFARINVPPRRVQFASIGTPNRKICCITAAA
jgi:hypothetical protein